MIIQLVGQQVGNINCRRAIKYCVWNASWVMVVRDRFNSKIRDTPQSKQVSAYLGM